ncbi:hypothetical protein TNCV_3771861 [Trichonephila clavipes]|nr:hypothetical protein TNCV_3771861 [Trichonephila clavipes]
MGRTYLLKNSSGRSPLTDGKMPCLLRYDWTRPIIAESGRGKGLEIISNALCYHNSKNKAVKRIEPVIRPAKFTAKAANNSKTNNNNKKNNDEFVFPKKTTKKSH